MAKSTRSAPRYEVNDLLKYRIRSRIKVDRKGEKGPLPFSPNEVTTTALIRLKTVAVKSDGSAVIATETSETKIDFGGNSIDVPPLPPTIQELDSRGRIIRIRGFEKAQQPGMLGQIMNLRQLPGMGVLLPEKPVKLGDTWEEVVAFPMFPPKAKVSSTLLSAEPVNGLTAIKLRQVWTIPYNMNIGKDQSAVQNPDAAVLRLMGATTADSAATLLTSNGRLLRSATNRKTHMEMTSNTPEVRLHGKTLRLDANATISKALLSATKAAPPAGTVRKSR